MKEEYKENQAILRKTRDTFISILASQEPVFAEESSHIWDVPKYSYPASFMYSSIASEALEAGIQVKNNPDNLSVRYQAGLSVAKLELGKEYRYPFYTVSPPMVEALLHTDLDEWNLKEVPPPFPVTYFLMPSGVLQSPSGGYVTHMGIMVVSFEDLMKFLKYDRELAAGKEWYFCMTAGTTYGETIYCHTPCHGDIMDVRELSKIPFSASSVWEEEAKAAGMVLPEVSPDEDSAFIQRLTNLAAQLCHVMAEPKHVTGLRLVKKIAKTGKERWEPRKVGARYVSRLVPSKLAGPTGFHPRLHAVRGHWKRQPYGPLSLGPDRPAKRMWLQPYLRGGLTEEEAGSA